MIILKTLRWSYAFSYGKDNEIRFDKAPLTQLIGRNGHGKTSIPLILQEVLYNKNSKNTKRAGVLNRYANVKSYTIELEFEANGKQYLISTVRGSTQTVKLLEDGNDISSHTATGTYKTIESIIGMDHKTFTQIVNQSSALSLEFLTSTDTTRKKFLIELFKLSRYSSALEFFKQQLKDVTNAIDVANTKLKLTSSILTKYKASDLEALTPLPTIEVDNESVDKLATLEIAIRDIVQTNAKISTNNKYKELLSAIVLEQVEPPINNSSDLMIRQSELTKEISTLEKVVSGTTIYKVCPSCKQPVDNSHKVTMVEEAKQALPAKKEELKKINADIAAYAKAKARYDTAKANEETWVSYYSKIDKTLQETLLDRASLDKEKKELEAKIAANRAAISERNLFNNHAMSHNARIEVIQSQLATAREECAVIKANLETLAKRSASLAVLVKAFGTSGLVAYKIESLIKDLEDETNKYLSEMSDGRFQLFFQIAANDKLDVMIMDHGESIDIEALSNGELARVNVSTLLAIRKIMQSLSNTRINLLVLDETIDSLDAEGKERLIQLLLSEEHLNTLLISHGFSHPLLEKVSIVKTKRISRIVE